MGWFNSGYARVFGRLANDAELKYVGNDSTPLLEFTVAWDVRVKKGGEWSNEGCFLDVTLFGKQAEALAGDFVKGATVFAEGELRQERWEDKQGQKRSTFRLYPQVGHSVHFAAPPRPRE